MSITGIVPTTKMTKTTKRSRLARKLAINVVVSSVYPFFNEIKKIFFLFLKGGYNGYKSYYCCIPTLIWSFLYLLPTQEKGTMGTIRIYTHVPYSKR